MGIRWIRRIAFGGAAVYFFYAGVQAMQQVGLTSQAIIPVAVGVLFGLMAVFGKGG
jgi:hypothetical protein